MPGPERRGIHHDLRQDEAAALVLVALGTVGAVLAIGAVHLPALLGVSAVAFAAAAVVSRTRQPRLRLTGPATVVAALGVISWVQALPLPATLVKSISPAGYDVWERTKAALGAGPVRWVTISLDPGASAVEGLKWLTYASFIAVAATIARKRGARWAAALVFSCGVLLAAVTLAHGVVDAKAVYGLYEPTFSAGRWHVGPLLNSNNLAGYLNLAGLCGIGLLLSGPSVANWRPGIGLGLALVVGATLASASRAGVVLLPLSMLAVGAVLVRRRGGIAGIDRWGAGMAGVAVLGGVSLALLSATSETWRELHDSNISKFEVMKSSVEMLQRHMWTGVGRGAFDSAFAAYSPSGTNIRYAHSENFVLQWASEWGVPVTALGAGALLWRLRPVRILRKSTAVGVSATVGLVALAIHNLVDLAFEVPGVMVSACVLLGAVWGTAHPIDRRSTNEKPGAWNAWWIVGVGASAACAAVALGWHDVRSERAEVASLYRAAGSCRQAECASAFAARLREAMRRHPAEPYFPFTAALFAAERNGSAMPWLHLALLNSPNSGRVHALLGDVLSRRGHVAQGFMHFRLAVNADPALAQWCAKRATARSTDFQRLLGSVPEGRPGALMLESLADSVLAKSERLLRRRLLAEALGRDPARTSSRVSSAHEVLAEMRAAGASGECAGLRRAECEREVLSHAEAVDRLEPRSSAGARLRAEVLRLQGRADLAESALRERCTTVRDSVECFQSRLEAALDVDDDAIRRAAINDYIMSRCTEASECASAAEFVAELFAARGRWELAVVYYDRALEDGSTELRWLRAARARSRAGAHARAVNAFEQVIKLRGGADIELRAELQRERDAVYRSGGP